MECLAAVTAAILISGMTARATVVPGGCEIHNNDSIMGTVDLPQDAIDLFCENGMSARTYCSVMAIDVGLPSDFDAMLSARDQSAINLAKGIVIMFLGHLQQAHGYKGTYVEVRLFSGTHRHYAGKQPIATATATIDGLADTTPAFEIEFHRAPTRTPSAAAAPAAQDGWKCLEPDLEFSISQAENRSQRMMLTRTKGLTVLGFTIQDRDWQMANEISEVALGIDGAHYSRPARYGLPEIELDAELAAALRRGLKLSVTIHSSEGNAHHYDSSLIGFTRAHNCVMQREQDELQLVNREQESARTKPQPSKRVINVIPDGQRVHYARGEIHALKQIVSLCMLVIATANDDISMQELARQVGEMQGSQNPDGLPEYFNKGVSDTFSRMQRALESTKEP